MRKSKVEQALEVLDEPITENNIEQFEVETTPGQAKVVMSTRFDPRLTDRIVAEAHRRGVRPSDVVRDLVEAGLNRTEDNDSTVTVRLSDLHRAVDAAVRRAA